MDQRQSPVILQLEQGARLGVLHQRGVNLKGLGTQPGEEQDGKKEVHQWTLLAVVRLAA
jgi:hypothetical protein